VSELTSPDLWQGDHVPFSFRYGDEDSAQLLTAWRNSHESVSLNGSKVERYSFMDPNTGLKVIAEVRLFADYPHTVDWVLRFVNEGKTDTPILEDILPLNWKVPAASGPAIIRHGRGSSAKAEDFEPIEEHLRANDKVHIESSDGDSSSGQSLPFINLQSGDHGLIEAIGWTGNWKADFSYSEDEQMITLTSGMKRTHLLLHPGEEIRSPRIVLMTWSKETWQDSQNTWRRLLLAHYTPQSGGKPMVGPVLFGSWGSEPIADKMAFIDWVHANKIPVDVYAVDAGWYGESFGAETDPTNPWWKNRGDWYPSKRYYPDGIRPLGDRLKSAGIGFSLWLEPETSMEGRKIIRDHPDWFLTTDRPIFTEGFPNPGVRMVDLGNPAALKGITELVTHFIEEYAVTWYRQDFNIPPERYWALKDTPDRVGMAEIRHIEGLYQLWDTLLRRYPNLRIDNCASGGRRLDIETMSRSFVVWRTDYGFTDTIAEQAQTQALAPWVPQNMGFETYTSSKPWNGAGTYDSAKNIYLMRVGYNSGFGVGPGASGVNNNAWVAWIKQAITEYRNVQPYFYGDYYSLLSYSLSADTWTASQWDRPEKGDGLVILLRRPESPFPQIELGLKHLDPAAAYAVEIRDGYQASASSVMSGAALSHLQLLLKDAPSSALVFYKKKL
jgi:alpha-galactosidase